MTDSTTHKEPLIAFRHVEDAGDGHGAVIVEAAEPALNGPAFGRAFGRIMQQHPDADARLVNDILRLAWVEAVEALPGNLGPDEEPAA